MSRFRSRGRGGDSASPKNLRNQLTLQPYTSYTLITTNLTTLNLVRKKPPEIPKWKVVRQLWKLKNHMNTKDEKKVVPFKDGTFLVCHQ